jgi:fermentation-respiration switch protein FrsA (DUF1100 family)
MLHYFLILLAGYLFVVLFLRWREPKLLYYPMSHLEEHPDQTGLPYEEVWLTTTDQVHLHAWYVPATNASHTVLFLHGNAGNISHRIEKLQVLHSLGVNTLIVDYRGYGRSRGVPNEPGTYRDAAAAYRHLTEQRRVPPAALIVFGESLGTAVAVELAVTHPVGGVILEEPFTAVADVGQKLFPFVPVRLVVRNKYDTLSKISRLRSPLLILHSRDDEMFALTHAQRLLAAAPEPKRLVELRGSHNDAFLVSAPTYRQALAEFLAPHR